jgi:RNA ligase
MTLLADVLDPAELASAVENGHVRGSLFLRLDGKDYRPALWQRARPAGDRTMHGTKVTEE